MIQADEGGTEKVVLSSPGEEKVYGARVGQATTYELEKSDVEEVRKRIEELAKQEEPGEESSEEE